MRTEGVVKYLLLEPSQRMIKIEERLSCRQKKTYKEKHSKNEAEGIMLMVLLDVV